MFRWLYNVIIRALAIIVFGYFFPSWFEVQPDSHWSVFGFVILISIIGVTVGTILRFILAPINWITFGLINFLINLLVIHLADNAVQGVEVTGILGYIGVSFILSFITKKTRKRH